MKIIVDYFHWDDSEEISKIVDFRSTTITEDDILAIVKEKMQNGELPFPMRLERKNLRFECAIDKVEM